jgi:hypothetical protein
MKKNILLLSFLAIISCGNSTPDESDIKDVARTVILRNLKDLNSVKFHHNEIFNDLGDNIFEYKETVNATNGFGGSIANNVTVKVKWLGGDPSEIESYSLIDIQFVER